MKMNFEFQPRASENKKREEIDESRRKFLTGSLSTTALLGVAGAIKTIEKLTSEENGKESNKGNDRSETGKKLSFSGKEGELSEKEKRKEDERLEKNARNLLENFLVQYEILKTKGERFWPKKIFMDDFFIAIQLQESGFDAQAESRKGAFGIMQTMDIAFRDVNRYLEKLGREGIIEYGAKGEIADELLKKIKQLAKENANYSRALGKLFFINLFDNYGIGKKEYKKGKFEAAQEKLIAAYNAGHGIWQKPWKEWPAETKDYCRKVSAYLQRLKNIKAVLKRERIKSNLNYSAMLIARKKGTPKEKKMEKLPDIFILVQAKLLKREEEKRGRALMDAEIKLVLAA